jgi:hypothetical protein
MGAYSNIDIDLQDMLATIETVADEHDIFNPDSDDALDGRAILFSRLTDLGWMSPTERQAARDSFNTGDGKRLLGLIGGQSVV